MRRNLLRRGRRSVLLRARLVVLSFLLLVGCFACLALGERALGLVYFLIEFCDEVLNV